MTLNPEFQRNLWLELTPHRRVAMPIILGAVFLLVYLSSGHQFGGSTATVAAIMYSVLAIVWGTRLAADSVSGEIRDHTWDLQRMSSLQPWSLAWGKLFGSTAFAWYGALLCLVIFAISLRDQGVAEVTQRVALMAGTGVLANTTAFLASLQALRKHRQPARGRGTAYMVLGIGVAAAVYWTGTHDAGATILWFGQPIPTLTFMLVSVTLAVAWGLTGVYRLMRAELQFQNGPWVWAAFVLFAVIYFAGLVHTVPGTAIPARLSTAYVVAASLAYVMIFLEDKSVVGLHRLIQSARNRDWRRVSGELPCWLIAAVFAAAFALGFLFTDLSLLGFVGTASDILGTQGYYLQLYPLVGLLFMVRDLGFVIYLNLAPNPQRADTAALLYLALLYLLAPFLLRVLGFSGAAALLWPFGAVSTWVSLISGGVQAALVVWLVVSRFRMQIRLQQQSA